MVQLIDLVEANLRQLNQQTFFQPERIFTSQSYAANAISDTESKIWYIV